MSAILYFLRLGIFKLQASYIYLFLLLLQRFLISIPTNRSMKISLFPGLRISLTYERTELVTKKKSETPFPSIEKDISRVNGRIKIFTRYDRNRIFAISPREYEKYCWRGEIWRKPPRARKMAEPRGA